MKMSKIWSLITVIMVVCTSLIFTACQEDEDESYFVKAGSTWKIVKSTEQSSVQGKKISFNIDQTVTTTPQIEEWGATTWSEVNGKLRITISNGRYMQGEWIKEADNFAFYKYSWYEADGRSVNKKDYTIALQK